MPAELRPLAFLVLNGGVIDGISVPMMMRRWEVFEKKLPKSEDVSPELKADNDTRVQAHRAKVRNMKLE
jgi:hypothetical protein